MLVYPDSNRKTILTTFLEDSEVGKAQKLWSQKDLSEISKGIEMCRANDFDSCMKILVKYHKKNPKDLFLHAEYAYSVYKKYPNDYPTRVKLALPIYEDLLKKIEIETRKQDNIKNPEEIVINLPFMDTYWKAATLYLDNKDYLKSKIQLDKALTAYVSNNSPNNYNRRLIEQIYLYMTEVDFYLKNDQSNQFYYCKTLQINPLNKAVKDFLLK